MGKTSTPPAPPDRGPRIGALLRLCHQRFHNRINELLQAEGLAPVIGAVTQPLWDHPEGLRLTELAAYAGITKQSMGELVERMEAVGYVERVGDPEDGRAKRVRFSARGRRVARRAREVVGQVEREWAARIGAKRLEALRHILLGVLEPDGLTPPAS